MLRIDRAPARVTLVSRLARPRVLVVLATALGLSAAVAVRPVPLLAAALAAMGALLALVGGRSVEARFERDRVRVRPAVPFQRGRERRLAEFAAVRVETVGEARRRKAERLAREYRARSGAELPAWFRPADVPGANDHLRRLVLLPRAGEPLPVTAWLAEGDLEGARAEVDALLREGGAHLR